MNKKQLREMFSKDYEKHYKLDIFTKEGFTRQKCESFFGIAGKTCGDGCPRFAFRLENIIGMWKKFASFFKKNGHEEIEDILFSQGGEGIYILQKLQ